MKSTIVDFIEMSEYSEIDLDVEPCIFPDCGHFLTASSMDGQMDMSAHYDIDPRTGHPVAIKASSLPFSMDEIKVCATCRGSLRSVSRYGRIVRRAMLDEVTKKFTAWSMSRHLELANTVLLEQSRLEATREEARKMPGPYLPAGNTLLAPSGSRLKQLHTLSEAVGWNRYDRMVKLWNEIRSFAGEVRREEQPFQRVADLVRYANQQHTPQNDFSFDESVLQVKGTIIATALLLRCELVVLSDFAELRKGGSEVLQRAEVKLDFETQLTECSNLVELARGSELPRQEVEGHLYFAQFCGIARALLPDSNHTDALYDEGLAHTTEASRIIAAHPSLDDLSSQVEAAETMLNEGGFY